MFNVYNQEQDSDVSSSYTRTDSLSMSSGLTTPDDEEPIVPPNFLTKPCAYSSTACAFEPFSTPSDKSWRARRSAGALGGAAVLPCEIAWDSCRCDGVPRNADR